MTPWHPPALSLQAALHTVETMVNGMHIAGNRDRANVSSSSGPLRCIILGAYTSQGFGVTRRTDAAEASGLLAAIIALAGFRSRHIPFSSICVTQNGQAPPHRDRNNVGATSIIMCGHFRGGELVVQRAGGRKFMVTAEGERVAASALQCRRTWNYFNAQDWHAVLPFSGDRISIALYCCRNLHRLQSHELDRLVQLGFVLPSETFGPQPTCSPGFAAEDDHPPSTQAYVTAADMQGESSESSAESQSDAPLDDVVNRELSRPASPHRSPLVPSAVPFMSTIAACQVPGARSSRLRTSRASSESPYAHGGRGPGGLAQQIIDSCVNSRTSFGRFYRAGASF
eukprot:67227-Amphidinium_carterae.2